MNITEFLEARIAEDEATANNATGARWTVLLGVNASMVHIDATLVRDEKWKYGRLGHIATTSHDAAYAEHIARYDPARVLAECAAKRAILALYEFHRENRDARRSPRARAAEDDKAAQDRRTQEARTRVADDALRALAAVYKDHPDYHQEWAPDA